MYDGFYDELTSAVQKQWGLVLFHQANAESYPSTENLQKLNIAIEGYKTLAETIGVVYNNVAAARKLN